MPRFDANGVSLYYEVAGEGPPLVLVHGFACGLRMWDPQVRALSSAWRVVTYDVRGHGISDAPSESAAYSQDISIADLRALLDHLGLERAAVGGLSMGGNIALNFALAQPARVSALIVADTGAGSDEAADWASTVHAFADTIERDGLDRFADQAMANPLFARYAAQGPEAERFIRSCLMTHRARGLAHTGRQVLTKRPSIHALEPRLRELRVPAISSSPAWGTCRTSRPRTRSIARSPSSCARPAEPSVDTRTGSWLMSATLPALRARPSAFRRWR